MVTKIIKEGTSVHPAQPIRGVNKQLRSGTKNVVGCLKRLHLVASLPLPCTLFIVCLVRGRNSGTRPGKKREGGVGVFSKDTQTHGNG